MNKSFGLLLVALLVGVVGGASPMARVQSASGAFRDDTRRRHLGLFPELGLRQRSIVIIDVDGNGRAGRVGPHSEPILYYLIVEVERLTPTRPEAAATVAWALACGFR